MADEPLGWARLRTGPCFFADFSTKPCDGLLIRAHLISKARLARMGHSPWDERSWEWCCGGDWPGLAGHHDEWDRFDLQIPYERVPEAFLELLEELGVAYPPDRRFGAQSELSRLEDRHLGDPAYDRRHSVASIRRQEENDRLNDELL